MDRASTFSDERVIELLTNDFIPVAGDVWYLQRHRGAVGEFYREVVFQREGTTADRTTQGLYIFGPDGELLRGWNNRDAGKVVRLLEETLDEYVPPECGELEETPDEPYDRAPPEGGLVVDVFARILQAEWPEAESRWERIRRESTGRDHLWVRADEVQALARGELPDGLTERILRFHLIDNTRGEPPMWRRDEIRRSELALEPREGGFRVRGELELATESGNRGYRAELLGYIEAADEAVTRFDLLVLGDFRGEGRWTPGAPPGEFKLGVAFSLAGEGTASQVPPQGSRILRDYLGL